MQIVGKTFMGISINVVIGSLFVATVAIFIIMSLDSLSQHVRRKLIYSMNRKVVDYSEEGWIVLLDIKHKVVGLYYNGHAVSHAKVRLGRDLRNHRKNYATVDDANRTLKLCIGDFRKIDLEIPRFSYRVLYEYKVPHETRVILI